LRRFNFDELLWFIVLILIDLSISYLIFTGKIEFYVGKKMIKYAYITIIMISLISIVQIANVFTTKGSTNIKAKLIPIIIALILGVISINTQQTFRHVELNNELRDSKTNHIDMKSLYEYESNLGESKNNINITNHEQEILKISEDNPMVLEDIRTNPKKYIGKTLEIDGFVCKESYLNENQFIVGRLVMTCCAADSKIVGIIGEYNKAYNLVENEKVKVRGVISTSKIMDANNISHTVPVIVIEELEDYN
jgi:putative membrane protein